MECVGIGVFILVAAVILLVIVSVRAQSRVDVWNQAFAQVARRFGGHLSLGGWFHQPQWRLQYGDTFVRLGTYMIGGRRGTRVMEVTAQVRDIAFCCDVVSKGMGPNLFAPKNDLVPLELRDEDFSLRWNVAADNVAEVRHLLSSPVRFHLDQIRRTPDWADTMLAVRPGWLILRRKWSSQRPEDLVAFLELAMGLLDQVQLTRSIGIDFLDDGQVKVIEAARCLVCGESLTIEIVYCRRCKTPHHRECWDYSGGCSTYGCRETQFLVPQHLPPADLSPREAGEHPVWPRPGKPR